MPQSRQKRDNDYYLKRLRDEFPTIFADYQAGKFKNAASAFAAVGLRKPKSGLDHLRSAWKKASPSERRDFKLEIGCVGPGGSSSSQTAGAKAPPSLPPSGTQVAGPGPIQAGGYLSTDTIDRLRAVMSRRSMKIGDVMAEMGFKKLNTSVALAMSRGAQIRNPAVLAALEAWLAKNPP